MAAIDENLGRVLEYLDQNQLAENTLVIYTSDQSYFLGEHDYFDKRFMLEESLRMPFVVRYPHEIKPGTVAIPHGWGHQGAKGLGIASRTRGVNVNLLAGSGPDQIDPLSGMSKLTALEVSVRAATGKQAHTWSGIS